MSLKAFHIFFIFVSTLLTLGFAIWCFAEYRSENQISYLLFSILSAAGCVGLVVYGVRFVRKLKDIRFS